MKKTTTTPSCFQLDGGEFFGLVSAHFVTHPDVTLLCQGSQFKTNRQLLSLASEYFQQVIDSNS